MKQDNFVSWHLYGVDAEGTDITCSFYSGADKSLAQPGREQATATDDF